MKWSRRTNKQKGETHWRDIGVCSCKIQHTLSTEDSQQIFDSCKGRFDSCDEHYLCANSSFPHIPKKKERHNVSYAKKAEAWDRMQIISYTLYNLLYTTFYTFKATHTSTCIDEREAHTHTQAEGQQKQWHRHTHTTRHKNKAYSYTRKIMMMTTL